MLLQGVLLWASVATALNHPHGKNGKHGKHEKHDKDTDYPVVYYPCPDCSGDMAPSPVTVTKPYQMVQSCHPDSQGKPKCSDYAYVNTVLPDCHGKEYTVTKTDQHVTLCHTKTKLTHTSTGSAYATPSVWYEDYEKTCEAPYDHLGAIGLPGYEGSGLCGKKCHGEEGTDYQPMKIKECYDGKCSTYDHTYTHGAPIPKVTTYDAPGVYTVDGYDMTVTKETAVAADALTKVPAGKPVEYGGVVTDVAHPTTITAAYPVYKKHGHHTKTYIKYATKVCPTAGKYTVVKPHTASYDHDTTVSYPTVHFYKPGVYHHKKEVVTITKAHQHHTFTYKDKPRHFPTGSPHHRGGDDYPTGTKPPYPDPSSDHEEPAEQYGKAYAGYSHHGAVIKRKNAPAGAAAGARPKVVKKRVILV